MPRATGTCLPASVASARAFLVVASSPTFPPTLVMPTISSSGAAKAIRRAIASSMPGSQSMSIVRFCMVSLSF
jgi:hypothetical protein